ncbi:hypothetical protein PHYPO_G00159930 [Pangasianodon hypophthalmus]|uniref:Uncharacterized protein n=1 Tax=Pangasianodon hypophthalmus TaxID=310915 RepID=A0A5N5JYS4_PANHP|nr:hypothetical protein PHYPO_G00159930 [Pangasianodon hypophthalmus]
MWHSANPPCELSAEMTTPPTPHSTPPLPTPPLPTPPTRMLHPLLHHLTDRPERKLFSAGLHIWMFEHLHTGMRFASDVLLGSVAWFYSCVRLQDTGGDQPLISDWDLDCCGTDPVWMMLMRETEVNAPVLRQTCLQK